MELKQLAESLAIITFRKKLMEPANDDLESIKNRPLLWQERIQQEQSQKKSKARGIAN